jgi:hypothetical protein
MENLLARTEIHEALANVALADAYLTQNRTQDANGAIFEADRHYRNAKSMLTILGAESIHEKLSDLRTKLNQIRHDIKNNSHMRSRRAGSGQ